MIKLVNILREIKIVPDYNKEWFKIWNQVMIDQGWDPNIADQDEDFADSGEDAVLRIANRIFQKKFGIEYNDTIDEIRIAPNRFIKDKVYKITLQSGDTIERQYAGINVNGDHLFSTHHMLHPSIRSDRSPEWIYVTPSDLSKYKIVPR